ncbi:hypothetical protein IWX83_003167 [Flavobacterium sp. CG_9.1]|uniref:hypothetical protein n=1 Tax=Flavobacterium sp. CG_9.1 TaxID=2787728 RepID=UPI0018C8DEC1|nr:hypothetical protein [Flavobacterium sp. CG_9.1]MBG6063357.1 hypothetical protein [Flavobacterium sp. CG_9.1]
MKNGMAAVRKLSLKGERLGLRNRVLKWFRKFLIFRLDLLFLLHQGKRKEYFHENYSH